MQQAETGWRWGKPVNLIILALFILYSLIMIKLLFIRGDYYRWNKYNYNIIPFHTIKSLIYNRDAYNTDAWVKNLFGNIVLFIPLGVFIPVLNRRMLHPVRCLTVIILLLLLVELIQLVTRVGSFDIDDIILNTSGAIIGLAFMTSLAPWLLRQH
ncbi:VanZ family protein [Paenibacillus glycanilyticus]|uniref:VanZ family protein n=1 Tax=Paenibacillus glycanilyticus TaxID=126569 RepID=UPI00203BE82F|nr:VanZ family protein [Paenibacillus glycanilyticus]MCM3628599.1 VanZ family protein [Paenibacillus glycanilyticus]